MIQRPFLLLLAACVPLVAAAQPDKPNIIIFLVDDMGVMDTSLPFLTNAAGEPVREPLNGYYRTPQMERLAATGIRFNQFCAMSVCSPTRVSIMTGQNAARHHVTNWISPDKNNRGPQGPQDWDWKGLGKEDVTLARLLQTGGYRTIHVGKGHFGPRGSEGADPLNLGFDVNVGGASFGSPGSYYGEKNYGGKARSSSAVPGLEKYHGTGTFLTEALTIEANARVADAVSEKKPFFLYFAHYAVHAPFESDSRFAGHYKDSGKPAAAQAFATLIEGMDKSLGDVLDNLQKLGVAENTLVVFLGDNGSDAPLGGAHEVACAAPLRGKKGSHYEGGVRVPFIASWAAPGPDKAVQQAWPVGRGAIQSQLASVPDIFPTVLELAGVTPPAGHPMDGHSLKRLLTGQPDPARAEQFLMHYPHSPHRSDYFTTWRDGGWKVIYHYFPTAVSGNSHYQLFHLSVDPYEQNDLSTAEPGKLREMMQELVTQLEKSGAQYPLDKQKGEPVKPEVP
jgi:arylsulfatase A-like enzyme